MKIAIVGGGLTGLVIGYLLASKHEVTIFESEKELGGLLGIIRIGKTNLEKFYHHIFTSDREIIDLIHELNLTSKLHWYPVNNGLLAKGKLYSFSTPWDLLKFRELSFRDRLAFGFFVNQAKKIKDWHQLDKMRAKDWVVKNAGENIYKLIWEPLLFSKFGENAAEISAAWLGNKIQLRGLSRQGLLGKEVLGYLEGGFGQVIDALAKKIKNQNGKIFISRPVKKISKNPAGSFKIYFQDGVKNFDQVIVTTSPEVFLSFGLKLPSGFRSNLKKISYQANLTLILELKKKLSPYYWLSIADQRSPLVGIIEQTNMISKSEYGSHLVYLSRYLAATDPLFRASKDKIKNQFIASLKRIFPDFKKSAILKTHLHRARYAQPIIKTNYFKRKPAFETPVKNLYLATMAQIYPEDRGINYAIKIAHELTQKILK